MKKAILVATLVLGTMIASACPRPTGHAVVTIGCCYYLNDLTHIYNEIDNLGINYSIGYETSNRYNTFAIEGNYIFNKELWSLGGEYRINPLGIEWGYDTPINFSLLLGVGYRNTNSVYVDTGLELTGHMGLCFTWFISDRVGRDFGINHDSYWHNEVSAGFRFWLGKGW